MNPYDYALLAKRVYTDAPTVGAVNSASRMRVYDDVHCFRGSDDVKSWMADFDVTTTDVWGLGKLHAGFYGALAAILPACLALPRPNAITGHSLGAALAILYAGVLAQLGTIVPVYAFEPPRMCADAGLQNLLFSKQVPWYAYRNGNDVVTQVPMTMTLPGHLTQIGTASEPFDNPTDHSIDRVIQALKA
jgi:triacylglycerol lipase